MRHLWPYGARISRQGVTLQQTEMPASFLRTPVLPRIDISRIPELGRLTGLFGSLADAARLHSLDDNQAELLACLYEFHPGA